MNWAQAMNSYARMHAVPGQTPEVGRFSRTLCKRDVRVKRVWIGPVSPIETHWGPYVCLDCRRELERGAAE